jgi:hypothetical protein
MTDLHQARTPNANAGIDAIGWLFSALVAAIVVGAGVIAYRVASAGTAHQVRIMSRRATGIDGAILIDRATASAIAPVVWSYWPQCPAGYSSERLQFG